MARLITMVIAGRGNSSFVLLSYFLYATLVVSIHFLTTLVILIIYTRHVYLKFNLLCSACMAFTCFWSQLFLGHPPVVSSAISVVIYSSKKMAFLFLIINKIQLSVFIDKKIIQNWLALQTFFLLFLNLCYTMYLFCILLHFFCITNDKQKKRFRKKLYWLFSDRLRAFVVFYYLGI